MKTPAGHGNFQINYSVQGFFKKDISTISSEISFKGTESLAKHMLCDKNGYFQRTPNSSVK